MSDKNFELGIIAALNSINVEFKRERIGGYLIERIVNENNAVWWVFQQCSYPFDKFQYTPAGSWEELE